ncbi:hypothetical protein [Methanolobus sp. ZRKC5]|uniref:hypothetical protein n=1 Tax=unclassified Methanolobus TaxID=2629569 RepID=UPI00313BF8E4
MRKMNVLLLLAVLILSMTHTASGQMTEFPDGCYCVELVGDYGTSTPATDHIEVTARVCKSGDDIDVTVLESNPEVTIINLDIISLFHE